MTPRGFDEPDAPMTRPDLKASAMAAEPLVNPRLLTRQKRRAWVHSQLQQGLSLRDLARVSRIPASTLWDWSSPISPGVCACGAAKLHPGAQRCPACHARRQTRWTSELLLAERDRYIRTHGGRPPTSSDWNSTPRAVASSDWPPASAVYRRFLSWPTFLSCPSPPRQTSRSAAEDLQGR